MDFWTVTLVSLVAGLILIIGGALVVYMGSLVKSAYQLKIEIKAEMDDGLRKIEEDTDKKSRWIKRDLIEEIEKMKVSVATDNQRKFADLADSLGKRLGEAEDAVRNERAETAKTIEALRRDIMVLDQRQRNLRRDQKASAETPPPATAAPSPSEPTASAPVAALPAPSEMPVGGKPVPASPPTTSTSA